jgi:formate dehydrogenase subunit gamma
MEKRIIRGKGTIMPRTQAWDEDEARAIIAANSHGEGPMLPVLHALQAAFGFISEDAMRLVAAALNVSRAEVYGVVSFYHDFHTEPGGAARLKICRAEACQAMGSETLAAGLLQKLGLDWGGTTADGRLTVEAVYCLGLCACAPAAMRGDEVVGRLDAASLAELAA